MGEQPELPLQKESSGTPEHHDVDATSSGAREDVRGVLHVRAAERQSSPAAARQRLWDDLDRTWNLRDAPDRESRMEAIAAEAVAGGCPKAEVQAVMERARNIKAFTAAHPTPNDAFRHITGEDPFWDISWDVRPYGICLSGWRNDVRKLGLADEQMQGAAGGCTVPRDPEMSECIAVVCERDENSYLSKSEFATVKEHEFVHMRLSTTAMAANRNLYEREFGNSRYILSRLWTLEDIEKDYAEAMRQYCECEMREEIAAVLMTTPEQLREQRPVKNSTVFLFDSEEYSAPLLYQPYTQREPGGKKSAGKLEDRDLANRMRELGPPYHDDARPSEAHQARANAAQEIRFRTAPIYTRYCTAYIDIIREIHASLAAGIPREHLLHAIIDHPYLEIANAMRALRT